MVALEEWSGAIRYAPSGIVDKNFDAIRAV